MPTTVTFESAILHDAVGKAARVAPNKGDAFDKAAGIHMTIKANKRVIVRATDLDTTFEQEIAATSVKGDACEWRLPSALFSNIIGTLPMGQGQEVDLIDRGGDPWLRLKSGRTVAKIARIDGDYPLSIFPEFQVASLQPAPDLANKIKQVVWAVDPSNQRLGGVRVDGERIIGCNLQFLAIIPCLAQVAAPVTVPLSLVEDLLKKASDFRIGATDKRFLMALDADTKMTTGIIEAPYPQIDNIMRKDFLASITVHRQGALDMLTRLMTMGKTEKLPRVRIEINGTGFLKMLTLDLDAGKAGRIADSIDVTSDFPDIFEMDVTPDNLLNALDQAKGDKFHMDFGVPNDPARSKIVPIQLRDDFGYMCWIMPRRANQS